MGFIGYFAFYPMLITAVLAWAVVTFFRQIRFAQYMIVILPVIFAHVLYAILPWFRKELPPHFMLLMLAITFVMGFLNILVSKRLGEF
jgi:glycerol-3-phosphate acyltransferase PlsY